MSNSVSSSHYPFLPIQLKIALSQENEFETDLEVLVDTGFDGGLAMPKRLIPASAVPISQSVWTLADETNILALAYSGYVQIGKLPPVKTLIIALGEEPIMGQDLISRFKFIFDHGMKLTVEP